MFDGLKLIFPHASIWSFLASFKGLFLFRVHLDQFRYFTVYSNPLTGIMIDWITRYTINKLNTWNLIVKLESLTWYLAFIFRECATSSWSSVVKGSLITWTKEGAWGWLGREGGGKGVIDGWTTALTNRGRVTVKPNNCDVTGRHSRRTLIFRRLFSGVGGRFTREDNALARWWTSIWGAGSLRY